ncbi:MAG: multicopper oxidase domain-containing protein [Geothrix sp.]|nr:multicopper oxidase domain-containing protein [Geothrix sp.]
MLKPLTRLLALAAALLVGIGLYAERPAGQEPTPKTIGPTAHADQAAIVERAIRRRALAQARLAAAERARPRREAAKAAMAAAKGKPLSAKAFVPTPGIAAPPGIMDPLGTPDYMGGVIPNWTNTPLIRKFVDTLPGLGAANANNLGNFIPVAVPNTTLFPGSDYYDISLVDYTQQLHSDLPATRLRGYKDNQGDGRAHYLGPLIIAERDRPVRVTFRNQLPTGAAGNLLLPVDTSLMGSGTGPGGSTFTQNRAELHLHGGLNPWISDGTPHQWITPAGDPTPNKKGASFANVPDMVGPGNLFPNPTADDGIATYFYTNQQSSRLMFYHDHTFGLTRLNVYAGEAAGYLLVDPVERKLITDGILPNNGGGVYNYGIPLIIQDKTFIPGPSDLAAGDPTWDINNWGGYGDLWYPHVYMPNQNPGDPSGANAMGRWDYGPWFWPPLPVSDTAPNSIPTAHGPKPGANPGDPDYPGTPNPSLVIESFLDTPVINGTAYPKLTLEPKAYRFRILNASNDRPFGMGFYYADPLHPTEVKMIPATPAEAIQGPLDENGVPLWPTDGRDGGVVDFRTKGPDIIQIGNESGFLPAPVVIPSQATTYNMNRRDIVVLSVLNHGLFLMAAERADVIVDFSSVPSGSKLILYSDMLAPIPAFDIRFDYFTGAPDQTATGGAPSTLEGYGPNTRTLMQVEIVGTPAAPFDLVALNAAFTSTSTSHGAFAATQHIPIVPQTFYNSAMNTTVATDTYATIEGNELSYVKTENGVPTVMPLQAKAIHELFETNYGRMNSTLAIELPFTNFNNQTTIPIGYAEPATEVLTDGTTQLWKITHNGVDTHPVHFHLFDVQIVNRVGWDGAVRFPEANELGWKETVKMNPLEDIVVALRPISPQLPFVLPNSQRVIDPTKDTNALIQITDLVIRPNMGDFGNPLMVPNAVTDYGWEYVWHCHILGHEENDFMRPVVLNVATIVPTEASALAATVNGPTRVDLAWTDGSINETGFRVERNPGPNGEAVFTKLGATVPDQNNFTDFTTVSGTSYDYRVIAYNQKGDSALAAGPVTVVPGAVTAPTGVTLDALPLTSVTKGTAVTFTALGSATGPATFQYRFTVNGTLVQDFSTAATYLMPATQAVGVYTVTVDARTSAASAIVSATIPYTITPGPATGVQLLPNLPSPQPSTKTIIFTATGIGSTSYQYQFSVDGIVLQAYSTNAKFTLPASMSLAGGTYAVTADVVTTLPAAAVPDATTTISYSIINTPVISGRTYIDSVPRQYLPGVTLTFSNGGGTFISDATGTYTAAVPTNWSGTITPTLAGYVFAPGTRTYTTLTLNQVGQDFVASLPALTFSGTVTQGATGLAGVTLTASTGQTTVTDASGNYSIAALSNPWTGSITASLAGFTFIPASRAYAAVSVDQTAQNFAATQAATISGQVTLNAIGLSGVTLTFSTGQSVLTDASGNYSLSVPVPYTGTVTPSRPGYFITPFSTSYAAITTNQAAQNYTAVIAVRVYGAINTNAVPPLPLAGVTVTFSNGGGTAVSDASGLYTHYVPSGWSGSLTPALVGWVFSPAARNLTNVTASPAGQNFTAGQTFLLSGTITTNGAGLAGVRVALNNGGGAILTDATGAYNLYVRAGWTGTITPTRAGFLFNPTNVTVAVPLASAMIQDFITVQTISGRARAQVNGNGTSIPGVTITLSTGGSVLTDANGNFTFRVPTGWTGSLSASGVYATWTPASFSYANLVTNVSGLRFNGL